MTLKPSQPTHGGRTSLADAIREDGIQDRARVKELAGFAFAGLVGEELLRGPEHVTMGCSSDVAKATDLLRDLIADVAASDGIGPVAVDSLERGREGDRGSEVMRAQLYEEVAESARSTRAWVRTVLVTYAGAIESLAGRLLEAKDQTLSGGALSAVFEDLLP